MSAPLWIIAVGVWSIVVIEWKGYRILRSLCRKPDGAA